MTKQESAQNPGSKDQEFWANYDRDGFIRAKAELINTWIPEGVRTIADIGCGNGIISNLLAARYDVTAVDISPAALSFVTTKKVRASALDLPFDDHSFDLALSSEMLEHLNSQDLHQAIRELKRISRRWILITVPHREQLAASDVKCAACGRVFNANGHLQSFNLRRLQNLFSHYRISKQLITGPQTRDYQPVFLKLRQVLGKQWFNPDPSCVCPVCGAAEFPVKVNIISKICNGLSRLFTRKRPYWIMLLFEKSD